MITHLIVLNQMRAILFDDKTGKHRDEELQGDI